MKYYPLLCIWWSFLLASMVTTKTKASTVTPSRRGIWFGRSKPGTLGNTTTANSTTGESNGNESKGGGGFLFGFGRQNDKQTGSNVGSISVQGNNNQTFMDEVTMSNSTTHNNDDGKSSTLTSNSTSTNEFKAKEGQATKGRGPFGFFKPVEQVKKTTNGNEEKSSSNEENVTVVEEALPDTNTQSLETGPRHDDDDKTANNDESSTPSPNSTQSIDSTLLGAPKPRFIVLGAPGSNDGFPPRPMPARYSQARGFPPSSPALDHQTLIAASVGAVVNAVTRIWLIVWLAKRLSAEDELLIPEQHFRWECLNDRYSKDATVLKHVFARPPLGISSLKWGRYLRQLRPQNATSTSTGLPTRNVIVVDITPSGSLDMTYLTDVVNFLVTSHTMSQFGRDPEIVLLLESPGGGVSTYGLAASQVGRLKQMGLNVTICIDMVAASGGYMIATQATKLVAAPFAQLGSIGVMAEGLNFNQLLNQYGVKPMILKAGEQKNRLSAFGPVTDDDLHAETQKLEKIHEAFIEMCLTERPSLDPSICDGTVMVASQGLQHGIVDRVLTSEEYIWECIQDGAHVLKLHKASMRPHPNYFLFRAMDLLPHLKKTIRGLDTTKLLSLGIQAAAFAGIVLRSLR